MQKKKQKKKVNFPGILNLILTFVTELDIYCLTRRKELCYSFFLFFFEKTLNLFLMYFHHRFSPFVNYLTDFKEISFIFAFSDVFQTIFF